LNAKIHYFAGLQISQTEKSDVKRAHIPEKRSQKKIVLAKGKYSHFLYFRKQLFFGYLQLRNKNS